jgi:adenine-specific DNA-methyltransferase
MPGFTHDLRARRQLGRYDTPRPLSQAISDWAIRSANDKILEPSSGSGVFVQSIVHRLKGLYCVNPKCQVWACDIDPGACKATTQETGIAIDHMWQGDFLSFADRDGIRGVKFDCIVGNPPYVSLHRMNKIQRQDAIALSKRLGMNIGGKSSLWAYFVLASLHALRENGRLGMILPQALIHADYSRDLLQYVSGQFTQCILLSIRERCFQSSGADERIVILLGDCYRAETKPNEIFLHESADVSNAQRFLAAISKRQVETLPRLNGNVISHFIPLHRGDNIDLINVPQSQALGDFAEIRIGVVTGDNKFFLLSEHQRRKLRIPLSAVIPLLPRFQFCNGLILNQKEWEQLCAKGNKCWLLLPEEDEHRKTVLRYLETYPKEKLSNNATFRKRKTWFRTVIGYPPDAFLRYMGNRGPRVAIAGYGVTCTNTIHRLYFKKHISVIKRKAIVLALHSSFSQLSAELEGRTYGSGVLKLEPSEALRIRVIVPEFPSEERVNICFRNAEDKLINGNYTGASQIIDEWLEEEIPALKQKVKLSHLRAYISAAVNRRSGDTWSLRESIKIVK